MILLEVPCCLRVLYRREGVVVLLIQVVQRAVMLRGLETNRIKIKINDMSESYDHSADEDVLSGFLASSWPNWSTESQ